MKFIPNTVPVFLFLENFFVFTPLYIFLFSQMFFEKQVIHHGGLTDNNLYFGFGYQYRQTIIL